MGFLYFGSYFALIIVGSIGLQAIALSTQRCHSTPHYWFIATVGTIGFTVFGIFDRPFSRGGDYDKLSQFIESTFSVPTGIVLVGSILCVLLPMARFPAVQACSGLSWGLFAMLVVRGIMYAF